MSLQVPVREKNTNGGSGPVTKAVILVGGSSRGTRFRPLSLDVPKVRGLPSLTSPCRFEC
jgi:mannose-1-phosphate guanylyltransferase